MTRPVFRAIGTALAASVAATGLGLAVFMSTTVLNIFGWVASAFAIAALVLFCTGWWVLSRSTGRLFWVAGALTAVLFAASQLHIQITQLRHSGLTVATFMGALACVVLLARQRPNPDGRWLDRLLDFALAGTLVITGGAFAAGMVQTASVLSVVLVVSQIVYWVLTRSHGPLFDRALALTLASGLPLALALTLRIGHAEALVWLALHLAGTTLLWRDFLGPQQQQDDPGQ